MGEAKISDCNDSDEVENLSVVSQKKIEQVKTQPLATSSIKSDDLYHDLITTKEEDKK